MSVQEQTYTDTISVLSDTDEFQVREFRVQVTLDELALKHGTQLIRCSAACIETLTGIPARRARALMHAGEFGPVGRPPNGRSLRVAFDSVYDYAVANNILTASREQTAAAVMRTRIVGEPLNIRPVGPIRSIAQMIADADSFRDVTYTRYEPSVS